MKLQNIHINQKEQLCSYDFRPSIGRKGGYVYLFKL